MYLPEERETVIRFDELDNTWYFETSVRKHITKIEKRIELYNFRRGIRQTWQSNLYSCKNARCRY